MNIFSILIYNFRFLIIKNKVIQDIFVNFVLYNFFISRGDTADALHYALTLWIIAAVISTAGIIHSEDLAIFLFQVCIVIQRQSFLRATVSDALLSILRNEVFLDRFDLIEGTDTTFILLTQVLLI